MFSAWSDFGVIIFETQGSHVAQFSTHCVYNVGGSWDGRAEPAPHAAVSSTSILGGVPVGEWGAESKMVLNNYISVPFESAQRAATKLITR